MLKVNSCETCPWRYPDTCWLCKQGKEDELDQLIYDKLAREWGKIYDIPQEDEVSSL